MSAHFVEAVQESGLAKVLHTGEDPTGHYPQA